MSFSIQFNANSLQHPLEVQLKLLATYFTQRATWISLGRNLENVPWSKKAFQVDNNNWFAILFLKSLETVFESQL